MDSECCKLGRIAEKFELANLNDCLTQRHKSGESLRDLESFVNKTIIKSALEAAGVTVLDDSPERFHRLLLSDETLDDARQEAESLLAMKGVDVDALYADFISYQTVRTHLQDCLGRSTSRPSEASIEKEKDNIGALRNRTTIVVERAINRLRRHGELEIGDVQASITIAVDCQDCGRQQSLYRLLERGYCSGCQALASNVD